METILDEVSSFAGTILDGIRGFTGTILGEIRGFMGRGKIYINAKF